MTNALSMLLLHPLNPEALQMCIGYLNEQRITDHSDRQRIIHACQNSANIIVNDSGYIIHEEVQ